MTIVYPTFFGPIEQYAAIVQSSTITLEIMDNFQKQTYRNRCYIYGANGKHMLNVPIKHKKNIRQKTSEVKIDYSKNWKTQHIKTFSIAYNSSPYYEFYQDDLISKVYSKNYKTLIELNIATHKFVMDALQEKNHFEKTKKYEIESYYKKDFRYLVNAKSVLSTVFPIYDQVFDQKYGFIPNLSILDLLFMEGPSAFTYLNKIRISPNKSKF